jgi:hypothetical protein
MGFLINLVKLNILLLKVLKFPSSLFCLIQLIEQVMVFMLDLIELSFDYDQFFVAILQISLQCF